MRETRFYHVTSVTMDPCGVPKHLRGALLAEVACPACKEGKRDVAGIDVTLVARPTGEPLNIILSPFLGLAHKGFIEQLGSRIVKSNLFLGRVYDREHNLVDDWVTFRGKAPVIVRGRRQAGYRTCETCGRNHYFAAGLPYLYPRLPANAQMVQSDWQGLVIRSELFEKLVLTPRMKRNLRIQKLPEIDPPPDGLGLIPYFADSPKQK